MAREFGFATEPDLVSIRSRSSLGSQLFQNKDRTSVYRRWSEKATITKYDTDTDSYNIIVSTQNVSSAVQKVDRTIRGVKSVIPTSVHQFKPGDSVLIGYVFERRESPIILGLRTNASSSVLGGSVDPTNIVPLCDLRCFVETPDGDTRVASEFINFPCTDPGSAGTGSLSFRVECAVGEPQWAWNKNSACTTAGCFASAMSIGEGNTRFTITKNVCTHSFGSTVASYVIFSCFRIDDGPAVCTSGCTLRYYNCSGGLIGSLTKSFLCIFGGNCTTDQPAGPAADCCTNPADGLFPVTGTLATGGQEDTEVTGRIPACGNEPFDPTLTTLALSETCGWFVVETSGTNLELETTSDTIDSMRSGGCCPCSLVDGTTVTVTDRAGRTCTTRIHFSSGSVDPDSTQDICSG
jgi:hypothetical protein